MSAEMEKLETAYLAIRGRLRHLRGELDVFLMEPHDGPADGFEAACVKDAKFMRRVVADCISALDGYEDAKRYNAEFEGATARMLELAGKLGKGALS